MPPTTLPARGALALASLLVVAGAFALVYGVVLPQRGLADSRGWTEVPCTIVAARSEFRADLFVADIEYRYAIAGVEHTSNRIAFSESGAPQDARAVVARHPAGSTSTCWVDPTNPTEAVLERRADRGWLFGLLGATFLLVGSVVGLRVLTRRRT